MIVRPYQDVRHIKKLLEKYVFSQSTATRDIALAVANHFLACEYNEGCDRDSQISTPSILIFGPSGCGKTACINALRQLCDNFSCGFYMAPGSSFSPNSSWKGVGIENIVSRLYMDCGNKFFANHPDNDDPEFAIAITTRMCENGIIVIDEFDKLIKNIYNDGLERSSSHDYQSSLLKLVEGTEVTTDSFTHERKVPVASDKGGIEYETIVETLESSTINTAGILWVFLGAFEGLDKITERRIQRENNKDTTVHDYYQCCHAGFIQDKPTPTIIKPANNSIPPPNVDDLVEYGLKRELAGRLAVRVRFNPLKTNDLIRIMRDCPTSAYREFQRRFALMNHSLIADSSALRFISQNCLKNGHNGTGARALQSVLYEILSPVMYELSAESEPCVCKLTGKRLKNGLPPLIEKQKPQKDKQREEEILKIIQNSKIKTESA